MSKNTSKMPYRQIRALHDKDTITVYQAYSSEIAIPAIAEQRLSASPKFKETRMTWIKPSWSWVLYRAGYGFKDPGQARILALRMKHQDFQYLLQQASVTSHQRAGPMSPEEKARSIRVQWDPERNFKLGILPYRSIQIGISGLPAKKFATEFIENIEDVTEKAHALRKIIEDEPEIKQEELVKMGLIPEETPYEVSDDLRKVLEMDVEANT